MGIVVGVFGKEFPSIALILFLMFLTLNQVIGGWVSPVWFDFFTKLTRPFNRGRLIGIRSSGGALLGFANGMILTAMLAGIHFPYNFAFAFLLASMFQYSSSYIQNKLIEVEPIETEKPLKSIGLFFKVVAIIKNDSLFRKFLISSAFSVIGFIPVSFFTVTAMLRLSLESSAVGFFAVIAIAGQVLSSAILGLLADKKGYKVVLIICSTSLIVATLFVLFGYHLIFFYAAFFLSGVTIGADLIMRYNFTADCTDEVNRAIYVGLMNAILAPFYLSGLLAGILSDFWGYEAVFIAGLFFNLLGVLILFSVPEPRKLHSTRLALSSK
jgi:MFS family permease